MAELLPVHVAPVVPGPAQPLAEGLGAAAAELGGAFLGGTSDGQAGLPSELVRTLTQSLAQSLASSLASPVGAHNTAAALAGAAETNTRLLDVLPQPPAQTQSTAAQAPLLSNLASAAAQVSADTVAQLPLLAQEALHLDRNAHLVLQVPQPATPTVGVAVLPQLLSALHAGNVQQHAVRVRRERERRHALPSFEPEEEGDDGNATAPAPARDAAAALPASLRRFRALWPLLQSAPPPGAAVELAQRRRVMLVTPRAGPGAAAFELDAYLLGLDAQGVGRAARYRARGAWPHAGIGVAAPAWQHWRVHRDMSAGALPRLLASRGSAPLWPAAQGLADKAALTMRLTTTPQPPPLRDARTAWLDLLDTRRFLHDLGTQWSLLVLWSARAADIDAHLDPNARAGSGADADAAAGAQTDAGPGADAVIAP